ncbi:MAG: DUF2125 domain-containing protein [Rhodospirillales bacterium]|nr:DUF2125 domain-containing protein [Rhodospirillales bacterium]
MARRPNDQPDRDWQDYHHPAMSYETPKQLRRFRAGMAVLMSVGLVAGLWTGLWFIASHYVQSEVEHLVATEAARAAEVGFDAMVVSGFPSRIVLTFSNPRYSGLLAGDTVAWRGEALTLSARPWLPWHLHADAPGHHEIETIDGRVSLSGDVARLSLDVVLGDAWPERLTLDLQGLNLSGSHAISADALALDLTHDAAVTAGGTGLALAVSGTNVTLPLGGAWRLGDRFDSIDAVLSVTGPVQLGPLAGSLPERLSQWRDVGGAVQVERLSARIGSLGLATTGTLALDGELQPVGAFTAKFEGLFQLIETLRKQGIVRDGDAVLATMALSAMSKRPPDGGAPTINLAVSVQDRKLSLGVIPILELPVINWGQTPRDAVPEPPVRDYKNGPSIY